MASSQRRYTYLALVIVVITLCVLKSHLSSPKRLNASTTKYYKPTPQTPIKTGWSWSDHEPHYPLETLTPLPTGKAKRLPPVQHRFNVRDESQSQRTTRLARQEAVKAVFQKCWRSYRAEAWMKDELRPISGGGRDTFGGWAATLVDSLDTLWIMGLKDEFEEAVTAAVDIDFTTSTDKTVNVFETTIRYLGGFLAAYDLSGDARLLDKAVEVGEMLLVPFDTPNHLPITRWDWRKAARGERQVASNRTVVAELGSFSIEFTRLSQLTGDLRWYDAIDRITRLFDAQQNSTRLPGMWPVTVDPAAANLTQDVHFTLGGMSDSLYEYFPKEYALLGGLEPVYQKMYRQSMQTAADNLFFRPMTPDAGDYLISGDVKSYGIMKLLEPRGQHLGCFIGGMLALGGRLFGINDHLVLAKKITDGCIWAYNATTVGVMPEVGRFLPCPSLHESCPWSQSEWREAALKNPSRTGTDHQSPLTEDDEDDVIARQVPLGYSSIPDPRYILRPEALESVFYMYRVSGDRVYLEHAWKMFSAIQRISETELANAAVSDITHVGADGLPPKKDSMESFWPAETLKYAYLIFSEPNLISLDDFVFNTEAHPFRRPT